MRINSKTSSGKQVRHVPDAVAKIVAEFIMRKSDGQRCVQVANLGTAIEPGTIHEQAMDWVAVFRAPGNGIGQLDLATGSGRQRVKVGKNISRENVATDYGQIGRGGCHWRTPASVCCLKPSTVRSWQE